MIGNYKIIALCTCRIQDNESHNFIEKLNEKLVKIGCRLFIFNSCWVTTEGYEKKDPQLKIFDLIDAKYIDAVIIQADRFFNKNVCKNIVDKSLEVGLPVISLGLELKNCLNIIYNHQKGFYDIINHLIIDHKIRDFHMIAGLENDKYSIERIEVFKKTLKENNITVNDNMISYGNYWPEPTKKIVLEMIKEKRLPRAFVCANDKMAIAVIETLKNNKIRVPEDIVVTGFDCIDEIYSSEPTITSAYISSQRSAQVVFETVKNALENNKKEGKVSLDSSMVINESCGCKSSEKIDLTPYLNDQRSRFCQYQDDDILFAQMSAKMQVCNDFCEAVNIFKGHKSLKNTIVLLKESILDGKNNPQKLDNKMHFKDMYLLYNGETIENNKKVEFEYLIPNLDEYLEDGRSLTFSALHYLDNPLGYVCFYFKEFSIANYYRITQIISMLNNGIGSMINLRHSQYLVSEIENLYKRDALTGLYNRRAFLEEYNELLNKYDGILTVIMSDLDGLKHINDTYGHEEGDIAIFNAAKALEHSLPENTLFTRYGGDEMLAVYPGKLDDSRIFELVNEFLDDYNSNICKPYNVSTSIGVYYIESGSKPGLEELIKYADIEMYKNKIKKKNNRC